MTDAEPLRPYPPGTPLVAVHEATWQEAEEAMAGLPGLEDSLANAKTYIEWMPGRIAEYLESHTGGDEADPWQAGHNFAMLEAARLVREKWWDPDIGKTHTSTREAEGA